MSNLDVNDLTLSQSFERAFTILQCCDHGASASPSQAADCSRLLSHCQVLIESAALFSCNEDKDDVATTHLKYLLVPYLMAELLNSQPQQRAEPLHRLQQLQESLMLYTSFLQRCDKYGLLVGASHDAYSAEEQGTVPDPSTCRNQKIERFKRSRALKGLMQHMQGRKVTADEGSGVESGGAGGLASWDEEDDRQLWILQLEAAAIRALDARPLIQQEMLLQQHVVKQQQQKQTSNKSAQQQQPSRSSGGRPGVVQADQHRTDLQQQMMNKLAGIAGQLSLSGDRQAMRQQVFRPSHILPTLSVEQQGDIELREARQREAQQQQAEARRMAARAEAGSDDGDDDQELRKQRAWDDFKDDNPRGWGNSKLRPCS